jgi:two-component system response regulator GlrR
MASSLERTQTRCAALQQACMPPSATDSVDFNLLRLQLRVFLDDPAETGRIEALLRSLGRCELRRFIGSSAKQIDAAPFSGICDEQPSLIVLVLAGTGSVSEARSTIRLLHAKWPGAPVFVLTRGVDDGDLSELICGVFDFAMLDCTDGELRLRLRRALGVLPLLPVEPEENLTGDSPQVKALRMRLMGNAPEFIKLVRRLPVMAASDASVLLLGETGTGKEVCAQAIHYSSQRSRGPWVPINCAAVPPDLFEDELFGHVRGAYTHAMGARQGLVQEAEGGTLFLDEIDSMPFTAQAKLLRFLQDKQYRVVGASALHTADVRVIAASNRDLRQVATQGSFRQDLFFRLNVLCLTLPPLRERREDVPLLAMHFLEQANRESGRHLRGVTPAALRRLQEHPWPGNVRELKHMLQRAVLLAQGHTVQAADIEFDDDVPAGVEPVSFREAKARAVEAFERRYIEQLLMQSEGNISRAARVAQKNRRAFFELLRRYEIDATRYRGSLI